MRYRCYNVATLAMQCRDVAGDFVFAGISYGVSARVLYDFVEFEKLGKVFHLIDPFTAFNPNDRRGRSDFYNTDPDYVRAQYPVDAPVKICRDIIPDALTGIGGIAFAALNTTNPPAETASLPILFNKLAAGGIIVIDTYGMIGGRFADYDPSVRKTGRNAALVPVRSMRCDQALILARHKASGAARLSAGVVCFF